MVKSADYPLISTTKTQDTDIFLVVSMAAPKKNFPN